MYQAIVFLPLLGAILAGLIALFGAHARNPSGDEMEHGHDDHGHATAGGHAAVAHASAQAPDNGHGHDDHAVEPPAAGSRAAELITTALLLASAALAWVMFVDVGFLHQP